MKVLYNWLKEFIDFPYSPSELAEALIKLGFEVEDLEEINLPHVVVGEVLKVYPHPNADRLKICQVWTGKEKIEVVCGAPNVKEKIKVALALPGAVLPGGMKIEKRKIRGVESQGMICSEKELGIGEDASGILILPEKLKAGENLFLALSLNEWVMEVGVTPNRGDCLSYLGLARELKALTGKNINLPPHHPEEIEMENPWEVEIENFQDCPRYTLRLIQDVKVKESPLIVRWRLNLSGIRSINNLVDVTNYVMLEWGQPLHAFDAEKIEGNKIIVRKARTGEKILTLDGVERKLTSEDLVIADEEKPIALAGVMGGEDTGVSLSTRTVLLESAAFHPTLIRRTSRRLGLVSESSYRFERSVDEENVAVASDRASYLIQEWAEGKIVKNLIDKRIESSRKTIFLPREKVQRILGKDVPEKEEILKLLGFHLIPKEEGWEVEVPSYRKDIHETIDLIEEIARVKGYDFFPSTLPGGKTPPYHKEEEKVIREVKEILVRMGLWEVITYSFIPLSFLEKTGWEIPSDVLRVSNPLSSDWEILRFSLIPGLLLISQSNLLKGNQDFKFFEVGKIYHMGPQGPWEEYSAGGVLSGKWQKCGWMGEDISSSLFHARGIVEKLIDNWEIQGEWKAKVDPVFQPFLVFEIDNEVMGWVGELRANVREALDIENPLFFWEWKLSPLFDLPLKTKFFQGLVSFPPVKRDLSLLVPEHLSQKMVEETIKKATGELLEEIYLFDLYRGKPVPEGFKSLTYSLIFRSREKTLSDEEVSKIIEDVIEELAKKGIKVRGRE